MDFDLKNEITDLLKLPANELMKAVLEEAFKDLKISNEEKMLIAGLNDDLKILMNKYPSIPQIDPEKPLPKDKIQFYLLKQRILLKELVAKTHQRAQKNGILSHDELGIYQALLRKVDEITANKMCSFMNLDLLEDQPNILIFQKKIGDLFSSLTATIILNVLAEKVQSKESQDLEKISYQLLSKEFSSDEANKEFMIRFKQILKKISNLPMNHPMDLLIQMNHIMNEL